VVKKLIDINKHRLDILLMDLETVYGSRYSYHYEELMSNGTEPELWGKIELLRYITDSWLDKELYKDDK